MSYTLIFRDIWGNSSCSIVHKRYFLYYYYSIIFYLKFVLMGYYLVYCFSPSLMIFLIWFKFPFKLPITQWFSNWFKLFLSQSLGQDIHLVIFTFYLFKYYSLFFTYLTLCIMVLDCNRLGSWSQFWSWYSWNAPIIIFPDYGFEVSGIFLVFWIYLCDNFRY